jgi:hypothetical protein
MERQYFDSYLMGSDMGNRNIQTVEEVETAFAEAVRPYENQWIAIDDKDGVRVVVGSGRNALEAAKDAETNGFPDAALFKVPSFTSGFVP